jgi:hypothetical protein
MNIAKELVEEGNQKRGMKANERCAQDMWELPFITNFRHVNDVNTKSHLVVNYK